MERITLRPAVLAVDDTIPNLIAIQGMLEDNFLVSIATSGEEGLTILSQSLVDVVLLDVEMPGMSGLEMFRKMREDPGLESIPVIFVTADKTSETVRAAVQMGAAGYTTKPYDPAALLQKTRQVLAQAEVDQGALYLCRKMLQIRDACLNGEDHLEIQMRFIDIPEDNFIPLFRLKLSRLGTMLKNGSQAEAAAMATSIIADVENPPATL